MMEKVFKYVSWSDLDDFLRCGWLPIADLGMPHGQWSFLCEWRCRCAMPLPNKVRQ